MRTLERLVTGIELMPTPNLRSVASVLTTGILCVTLLGCSGESRSTDESQPDRPNIVLLISDDHGWPYFGFMGDAIVQTPHIDALAARSAVFPYGFVHASTCRPSLMALLTGLYEDQWDDKNRTLTEKGLLSHVQTHEFREIDYYRTLPRELAKVGYVSFQGGKHWEGTFSEAGFTAGTKTARGKNMLEMNAHSGGAAKFARESIEAATEFIEASDNQPFFMWFAPELPHYPLDAGDEFTSLYAGKGLTMLAQAYYANISRLDARVGELLEYLDRTGRSDNTLVVFLSDNGWEQDPFENRFMQIGFGGPRGKASAYELGFRTPVLVSYPGRVKPRRDEGLVLGIDLFATMLDYAGAPQLRDRFGISLRALLEEGDGETRSHVVEKTGVVRVRDEKELAANAGNPMIKHPMYFVRTRTWRYIWKYATEIEELYRIDTDPYEQVDVAADNRETAVELRAYIENWLAGLRAQRDGYDVDGVVRDTSTSRPAAGLKLVLSVSATDKRRIEREAISDSDGRFAFRDLPPGDFTLTSGVAGITLSAAGDPDKRVRVVLPQGAIGGFVAVGATKMPAGAQAVGLQNDS